MINYKSSSIYTLNIRSPVYKYVMILVKSMHKVAINFPSLPANYIIEILSF